MKEETVVCPSCGKEFPLSAALTANIEKRVLRDAEKAASEKEIELIKKHRAELAAAAKTASDKAKDEIKLELSDLRSQLDEKEEQLEASRKQELALRKRERDLEDRMKSAELDIERRLAEEREKLEEMIADRLAEQHRLTDQQKDRQLKMLQEQIEELKRKATQGSQQAQGEVAELGLEAVLCSNFPQDQIGPVPKGVRGADVVQIVVDSRGRVCGTIAWEMKNTKNWSDGWLEKLRDDQRDLKADVAVIVSSVMPKDIERFAHVDGVWIAESRCVLGLATALRSTLIQVAQARLVAEGRGTKMEHLYAYLTGTEFRQRVEAVAEAFVSMQADLEKERRSMEGLWAKREKQIGRAFTGLAGMYGDMQGIVGAPLPRVAQLEMPMLEHQEHDGGEG